MTIYMAVMIKSRRGGPIRDCEEYLDCVASAKRHRVDQKHEREALTHRLDHSLVGNQPEYLHTQYGFQMKYESMVEVRPRWCGHGSWLRVGAPRIMPVFGHGSSVAGNEKIFMPAAFRPVFREKAPGMDFGHGFRARISGCTVRPHERDAGGRQDFSYSCSAAGSVQLL